MGKTTLTATESFINIFVDTESWLKNRYNNGTYLPFKKLIDKAIIEGNAEVKRYAYKLKFYGDIRNNLQHSKRIESSYVIEVNDYLVKDLQNVFDKIRNPITAGDMFSTDVKWIKGSDSLTKVLTLIKERDFSQFPVLQDKKIIGVLTNEAITKWFASNPGVSPESVSVVEVFNYAKTQCKAVSKTKSIFAIEDMFKEQMNNGDESLFLLVSDNGKIRKTSDIIGIITPYDLTRIQDNI